MWLIDRYVAQRFLANFIILLVLLFTFAIAIDLIMELEAFVDVANAMVGEDAGWFARTAALVKVITNFHGPRLFQFYAYMVGLLSVGAMGFTFAQMHRNRELVAILASGVRLPRLAMPVLAVALGLNVVQLLNQEYILPRLAPLLIRENRDIGKAGVEAFEIKFTADGRGSLLQAPSFDPKTETLTQPTILERDEAGRTVRRITADQAEWGSQEGGWRLTNGRAVTPRADSASESRAVLAGQPIALYRTDLGPEALTMRRFRQYATMLSLRQIRQALRSPVTVDADALIRFGCARFTAVMINMLVLVMTLPFFLLREPANLLRQSLLCAATAVPAMMGALLGFAASIPGIPPWISVFLPAIVLVPIAMFMVTLIRT